MASMHILSRQQGSAMTPLTIIEHPKSLYKTAGVCDEHNREQNPYDKMCSA